MAQRHPDALNLYEPPLRSNRTPPPQPVSPVSLPDNSLDLSDSRRRQILPSSGYHGVHTGVSTAGRSHCPLSLRAPLQILSPLLPAPSRAPILPETGILNQRMHMYPAPIPPVLLRTPPALLHTPSVLVLPLRHRGISAREIHLPDSPSLLPVRNPVPDFFPLPEHRSNHHKPRPHPASFPAFHASHGIPPVHPPVPARFPPGLLPRNSASLAARSAWRPRDQRHGPAAPPADGVFLPFSPHVSHGGGSYLLSHTHMPFRCPV